MHPTNTQMLRPNASGLATAAALLRAGDLVAFATETVYGLGADATNGRAVAAIFKAKGRPQFNPLISHVPSLADAQNLAEFSPLALKLATAFWPGPLTLILPRKPDCPVSDLATAGLDTIAIRCPAHPIARALLKAADRPIAAPSANPSGAISPTTAQHVMDGLNGKIAAILDGGPCTIGVESTILSHDNILLRPGGITPEQIQTVTGQLPSTPTKTDKITAPGQLTSHYAPSCRLILNVKRPTQNSLWLGFGPMPANAQGLTLSKTRNLEEAAANLFGHMHRLDALAKSQNIPEIQTAPIPNIGLGIAINDRLTRAAAPKP